MDIINKNPELAERFEKLLKTRCDEILSLMVKIDFKYADLRSERAEASMALLEKVNDNAIYEEYSDAVYEQTSYELNVIYKQAFLDALEVVKEKKIIL